MATQWHVEDWGTAAGTSGAGAWGQYAVDGWGTAKVWTVNGTALSSTGAGVGSGANVYGAADQTWTGSQTHSLLWGANQPLWYYTKLASFGGTVLYARVYRSTSASAAGSLVIAAGTSNQIAAAEKACVSVGNWQSGTLTTLYGSGTWSVSFTNSTTGTAYTTTYGAGGDYAPATLTPVVGFRQGNNFLTCLYSAWEYTPPDSILRFIGTWATGSGTYQWGGEILGEPGNVQDRAYGPDDTAGWASTVGITLNDSTGLWGSFAGTGQLPFEGLWNLRQFWPGIGTGTAIGSWVDLFTGYLEPDGLVYDYAQKQAKLTLQSTIARAAQTVAIFDGTISGPCEQELVGTITYADADTGTVRIGNHTGNVWEVEGGCSLWGSAGTATQSIRVGSSITPAGEFTYGGTGTITTDGEFPPWLVVGAPIWATIPWPAYTDRLNPSAFVSTLVNSLGLVWPADNALVFAKQAAYGAIAPNGRMYGGEKLTDTLSGIMKAINGFYSVDPSGQFRARCLLPNSSVAGTVDFNAAYDSQWQMTYEPAHSGVEVECSYNVQTGSYTEHVSVGGTQTWGDIKEYELQWLGSGIEAQSMAGRLYRNAYLPRPSLTLQLAGSAWATYLPGEVYAIHNLPAQVTSLLSGTQMILYSRTYDWADDLTAFEFVSMPGGNYAVWDGTPADFWEGSGKAWF